jgi:hypothetical protein
MRKLGMLIVLILAAVLDAGMAALTLLIVWGVQ